MSPHSLRNRSFMLAAALLLAGCATTSLNQAPIVDRSERPSPSSSGQPGAVPQPPAAREAHDGTYTVQRGDTLYSIALAFGQDVRDVARWNGIDDATRIAVGQSLRVVPPAGADAVMAVPVAPAAVAETQPLNLSLESAPSPLPAAPPAAAAGVADGPGAIAPAVPAAAASTTPSPSAATSSITAAAATATSPATSAGPAAAAVAPSAAAGKSTEATALGNWRWPADGKVIEVYQESRNKGIDIAGKEGDPVVAAADGQVVYSGSGLRGYGNLVILKHSDDFISAYAHNRQILVKQGESVKRGQRIADLGRTDSDVPKLHFEIRRQGKPVDPLTVLPKR